MAIDRLKSGIWVQAQVRLCSIANLPIYITKKGDPDAGAIFLRLNNLNGNNWVYSQTRDPKGEIAWSLAGNGAEMDDISCYEYLEKQKKYDPDLWIIEIEDPDKRYQFDGNII